MKKIEEYSVKTYKPEFEFCLVCNSNLIYKHSISRKVIQFSSGRKIKAINLGYKCQNESCKAKDIIYSSETAKKLSIKGFTYSAKVITMIYLYKKRGLSRDLILKNLSDLGIIISDRNIDNIYNKFKDTIEYDYLSNLDNTYNNIINKYSKLVLSVDSYKALDKRAIVIYSPFTNSYIGYHLICDTEKDIIELLKKYLSNNLVDTIITVRRHTTFYKTLIKVTNSNVKYYYFSKI